MSCKTFVTGTQNEIPHMYQGKDAHESRAALIEISLYRRFTIYEFYEDYNTVTERMDG